MKAILLLLIVYFFLMFFATRLVVPNLTFWKSRLPEKIPPNIMNEIKKLKNPQKTGKISLKRLLNPLGKDTATHLQAQSSDATRLLRRTLKLFGMKKGNTRPAM